MVSTLKHAAALLLATALPLAAQTPAPAAAPAPAPAAAAPAATAPAAASRDASAETVVATVNGEPITLGQMLVMKDGMHDQAAAGLPDSALWDLMLDQLIRQTAVAQQGAASMTARDRAALEMDRRGYLSGAQLERIAGAQPTDDELRAAYETAFPKGAAPKTEYDAAHILVATEDEAKAIAAEAAKPGADFGKLAEEKSTDNSAANKGDLGWFTPDQMVKPFADAVSALKKGEISAPVQSQFGWHVIKLLDTRTQTPPEFDAVKDQLILQVRRQKVEAAIQSAASAAKVDKVQGLDPALLSKTELLDK